MIPRFWIFLLCGLGILGNLSAQNFHVTSYNRSNGLPSNEVRHALRDSLGFLWIATDNGLVRTDGQQFKNYPHQLPSQYGRYLCPSPQGILLSHDAGISRILPGLDSSVIELYQDASIDPKSSDLFFPQALHYAPSGQLWIAQPNGQIALLHQGQLQQFKLPQVSAQRINICFAQLGDYLWIGTSEGQLYRSAITGSPPELIQNFPAINALQSNESELWIGSQSLYRLSLTKAGEIQKQQRYPISLGTITAFNFDTQGNILVGIENEGLHYLRFRQGRAELLAVFGNNDPHSINELPFKNIHRIIIQSDRELWICSSEGLGILRRRFFESAKGLPNGNTTAIATGSDDNVYVNFGDIYVVEPQEVGYEGRLLSIAIKGTISSLTTSGQELWIGSTAGLLYRCNRSGKIQQIWDFSERGEGIFNLFHDSKKRLWFCQAPSDKPIKGLGCLLPSGRMVEYGLEEGLADRVLTIKETEQGRFYAAGIGRSSYLYRYLPDEDAFINLSVELDFYVRPNFQVHDLSIDDRGIIWLATTDGLLRYDLDRVRKIDLGPELQDTEIRAVLALPDGSIWLSSDTKGVLRYQQGETLALKEESGLPAKVMAYRSLVMDQQGRLWVGSAEGIVYSLDVHPQLQSSRSPVVMEVAVDEMVVPSQKVSLFADQNMSVKVVCPAFHGYRTFYQYRINGDDWSTPSTSRQIQVPPLPWGKHQLAIRAQQEGPNRWSMAQQVAIEVRGRWYERKVSWGMILGLVALGIWGLWIYRRRWLQKQISALRKQLMLEQKVVEKREADLVQARRKIQLDREDQQQQLSVLQIVNDLISKVAPGHKWEELLEILSLELLQIPGIVAFEIGTKKGRHLNFDGFAQSAQRFTTDRIEYDPRKSLAAFCLQANRSILFNNLEKDRRQYLSLAARRSGPYHAAVAVPFFYHNDKSVVLLYADREEYFDEFQVKAMEVFTSYLEQIT